MDTQTQPRPPRRHRKRRKPPYTTKRGGLTIIGDAAKKLSAGDLDERIAEARELLTGKGAGANQC